MYLNKCRDVRKKTKINTIVVCADTIDAIREIESLNAQHYHFDLLYDATEYRPKNLPQESLVQRNLKGKTTKDELRFKIRDDLSGIKEYIGKINGNWILFNYDYKRDLIFSQKIDEEKPFMGNFELKIIDKAGNVNMLNFKL